VEVVARRAGVVVVAARVLGWKGRPGWKGRQDQAGQLHLHGRHVSADLINHRSQ
jgi:hypothetical protein